MDCKATFELYNKFEDLCYKLKFIKLEENLSHYKTVGSIAYQLFSKEHI